MLARNACEEGTCFLTRLAVFLRAEPRDELVEDLTNNRAGYETALASPDVSRELRPGVNELTLEWKRVSGCAFMSNMSDKHWYRRLHALAQVCVLFSCSITTTDS